MPSAPASLSDAGLVEGCRAGDENAWEALMTRFARLVYAIPRRAGLSQEAASDVFQEVFERLVEHVDHIEQPARIRSWIVTTARRATLRALQKQSHLVSGAVAEEHLAEVVSGDPWPGDELERLEQWHTLKAAVDQLDPRCCRLIEMLFYRSEPPSYGEVARSLGIPEGSIGPTRARCLARLRRLLEDGDFRTLV